MSVASPSVPTEGTSSLPPAPASPTPKRSSRPSLSSSSLSASTSTSSKGKPAAAAEVDDWPRLAEPLTQTLDRYQHKILAVRRQLTDQPGDDLTIFRFLRGWKMDVDKSAEQINKMMAFRKQAGLDEIRAKAKDMQQTQFPFAEKFMKCYPHTVTHSFDNQGQPISIERIGLANPSLLTKVMKLEEMLQYHYYHMEHKAAMVEAKSRESDVVIRTCKIMDLSGLGRQHLNRKGLAWFQRIIQVSQDNYPEMLGNLYVINTPWVFEICWKMVKPWLNENTLSKIQILGSNYQDTLRKVINPTELPKLFGGECTCESKGGCVLQIDPDQGMTLVDIGARNTHTVDIAISNNDLGVNGASILWEFRTRKNNISFGYKFVNSKGVTVSHVESKKYDSDSELVCGSYNAKEAGVFTLIFDNTYSRFTGKSLLYMYELAKLDNEENASILLDSLSLTDGSSPTDED